MNSSYPIPSYSTTTILATQQGRQRLVHAVLSFTEGTPLFPASYEQQLLDQFVQGWLTIDEVALRLDEQGTTFTPLPEAS